MFRLNIGVSRETYQALFGSSTPPEMGEDVASGYNFTALDILMPHPVYARQHWVCVLNPSAATFEAVRPLLAEAHGRSVSRLRNARPGGDT